MRKEDEINYFRANILGKYIKEIEQEEKRKEEWKQVLEYQKKLQCKRKKVKNG